jgi:hypothetical protein
MDEPRLTARFAEGKGTIEWSDQQALNGHGVVCAATQLADPKTAVPNIRRLGRRKNVALISGITLPSICESSKGTLG